MTKTSASKKKLRRPKIIKAVLSIEISIYNDVVNIDLILSNELYSSDLCVTEHTKWKNCF